MTRPRIVFATIAAGGGHVATARAMAQAVEALAPGAYDLPVTDLMLDLGLTGMDARHKAQWRWMLARPWTARTGQRVIDAFPAATRWVLRRAMDGVGRAAAAHFAADPPALIVANHGFLAFALTRARLRYGLTAPTMVFATEPLDASALWAEPEAERFLVPSRAAADDLARMGVPTARVEVVGYPVQQAFLRPPTKAVARVGLGLADRFTCLVSLGGEGIGGQAVGIVDALAGMTPPPQVVVVAGRNEGLARDLRARGHPGLEVRGFVSDMADHLAACDVVIGKAGPASVMEAVAVGRPVLVTGYAGLNEVKLLRWLQSRGLGHAISGTADLRDRVAAYVESPSLVDEVSARCRALDVSGMTLRLAHRIRAAADRVEVPLGDPGAGLR